MAEKDYGPFGRHDFADRYVPSGGVDPSEGGPSEVELTRWRRPRRRFTVCTDDGVQGVHEAADLTLDIVLSWEFPDHDGPGYNHGLTYDVAIFADRRAVAVVTRGDGHYPLVRMIDHGPEVVGHPAPEEGGDDA